MPLPDDIVPEDPNNPLADGVQPVAPQDSEAVADASQEQQGETDQSFDELGQISADQLEPQQPPAEMPPAEPQAPTNAEPPEVTEDFGEMQDQTTAEFEAGNEPPATYRDYLEQQSQGSADQPQPSSPQDQGESQGMDSETMGNSGGGIEKALTELMRSDLNYRESVNDILLDWAQKINQLQRALEDGRL